MATHLSLTSHRAMDSTVSMSRPEVTDDSAGSGAEGRARRKYPRTTSENDNPLRRQVGPTTSKLATDPKPPIAARRRSMRDHKIPLGPRPLDQSAPRRIISGDSTNSATRSFLPTSTSESFLTQTRGSNPRYSFSKNLDTNKAADQIDPSGTYDFLPSINFDEFHASLTNPTYEPELSEFPAPGGGKTIFAKSRDTPVAGDNTNTSTAMKRVQDGQESRISRSNSLVRRPSATRRQTSTSSTQDPTSTSMLPPSGLLSVRTRRQSQFPAPTPSNPAARAPRKSVGPGLITSGLDSGMRQDTSHIGTDAPRSFLGRSGSIGRDGRRGNTTPNTTTSSIDMPRLPTASRNAKARSLQPTARQTSSHHLSAANMTPDHPSTTARSPGRSPGQGANTPSSSGSKRQSTIPSHASGLGARTISPTDARRMKRLSMLPNTPAMPQNPPTPPEMPIDSQASTLDSPTVFRKSVTPSSSRDTPDQNRKSIGSGLSLSASSSFNSLRASTLSNRASLGLSGSRLPTMKPRNVNSSAGMEEEEVPPVPAIPKAYESPKDGTEHTSFPFVKPRSLILDESRLGQSMIEDSTSDKQSVDGPVSEIQTSTEHFKSNTRPRRGLTVGNSGEAEKAPVIPHVNKRSLQPLRLPPLNLLPLSTPTASRIASFPAPSAEVDSREAATPPPKRNVAKTPSTPMTASKASFFSKAPENEYDYSHLRSNSSHYAFRSDTAFQPMSTAAVAIPTPASSRQMTTPFASASLPKNSGEFSRLRGRPSGEYGYDGTGTDSDTQHGKPHGPRAQTATRKDKPTHPNSQTNTSTEPETPTEAPSLRRRLSEKFKRSSSKASSSHPVQAKDSTQHLDGSSESRQTTQPTNHGGMPPPRLPASATWSGPIGSPTGIKGIRSSLDQRRRKPSNTSFTSDTEAEKRVAHRRNGSASVQPPPSEPSQPPPKHTGLLSHMKLGSKGSVSALKARNLDTNLDQDDMAADEEMKKLASKRRDFESAAKEVDELRKRAKPQEKVSPAAALKMVNLNLFERGEIIDYKEIFFCGTKNAKKHVGDLNTQSTNFGYDDDRGDYNIVLGDHLAYRYEVVDVLGKGSFGQVVRCVDHKTGSLVAVKIIRNKKRFHQQALVEVNILQKLREWDPDNKHSMINFTQSFYFRGHLCISTELLGMNLYEFIKAHEFKGFSLKLIKRFTRQMLSSLTLLQTKRVIHCDLKPENILLAHPLHSEIKVIDFGSSCFENEKVYTYIQSRFYRSPEVILGMSYGMPIDMWSLGCILAELLTGYPIFPGENEQEQLACIMEIFGPPEKHLIEKSSRKKLFFDSLGKPRVTVSSKGRRRRPSSKTIQQALKCDDDAFLDFISRCLRWDPDRRMKPDEAMAHEFVTGLKRPSQLRGGGSSRPALNGPMGVSPAKRITTTSSLQTPQRARPLPEPPATSFKNGVAAPPSREVSSSSPVKGAGPRRHSTVHGAQSSIGVKRASNGTALPVPGTNSGLPRVAQRSVSGKPDLASAAAVASLRSRAS